MTDPIHIGSVAHEEYVARVKAQIDGFKHNFGTFDWVTKRIALGPYPVNKEQKLVNEGVTHILNVGDAEYHCLFRKDLFKEVAGIYVRDLREIPIPIAKEAILKLHEMLHDDADSKVYVHCSAGQNRSPNILWLYLTALGLPPENGIQLISSARLDAVPGHHLLVPPNSPLLEEMKRFGKESLLNFSPEVLEVKK